MQTPAFDEIAKYDVSRESYDKLLIFEQLLIKWQAHINLVAPSTIPNLWNRHIIDSLQILKFIPKSTLAIVDLGSGGGFPGLVLAISQNALVHFYESNAKKAAFLQEVLRQTKTQGQVHRERLEPQQEPKNMPQVDVVTARAFAPLPLLIGLAEPFLRGGARAVFHKGQECHNELTEAAKAWKIAYDTHPSVTDSQSVILEIKEIAHV